MSLLKGFFTSVDTLPPLTGRFKTGCQSEPVLGLFTNGVQAVVRAFQYESGEVQWEEVSALDRMRVDERHVVGWMHLPGAERSISRFTPKPVPITDREVYKATLEACVQAEASDQTELADVLRAWVDASPFHGCRCNGSKPFGNLPPCSTCGGEGFLPD